MRAGPSAQVAFKGLVIRLILQFIRIIACCRVLHRLESQDIHRCKLYKELHSQSFLFSLFKKKRSTNVGMRSLSQSTGIEITTHTSVYMYISLKREFFHHLFENFRNDPAAGSPTATLLRLLLPLLVKHGSTSPTNPEGNESPLTCIQLASVTTTGGVYKWQGRSQCALMKHVY